MFNIANIPPSIFHQKIRINHHHNNNNKNSNTNNNNNYNNDANNDDDDDPTNDLDSLPYYCEKRSNNRLTRTHTNNTNDDDNFSDDSLEGVSLPPQPPPPIVPPPPTLSAPATPNKRSSIAWEIMLEDKNTKNDHARKQSADAIIDCEKVFRGATLSQRSISVSDSQTSLGTTSENSGNCTKSADWAAVPDVPAICSTEDEAASLHSDSADDLIPSYPSGSFKGQGTFVIKGPKKRHRLSDLESSFLNHQNSDITATTIVTIAGTPPSISVQQPNDQHHHHHHLREKFDITANSVFTNAQVVGLPFSRHSIDLGSPQPVQNFPRYCLIV